MEGRTIARPYRRSPTIAAVLMTSFNGGPDNCPAIRRAPHNPNSASASLTPFNGGPDNCPAIQSRIQSPQTNAGPGHVEVPSMEGRTIARPYWIIEDVVRRRS